MDNQITNPETLRKRKSRMNETTDQREERLERDRVKKRQKRASETGEEHKARLAQDKVRKRQKRASETGEEHKARLAQDKVSKRQKRADERQKACLRNLAEVNEECGRRLGRVNVEQNISNSEGEDDDLDVQIRLNLATTISEDEHYLLQNFRDEMDNIRYDLCSVCNERIPFIMPIREIRRRCRAEKEICQRCRAEKNEPKKFSADNNMDPGEVPDELKGLTEIEEMLIAQVFTVITVYRLRGGQNGYRGNVINFPQDVQSFTNKLPRDPSTLDVLVVRRQSSDDPSEFRDFTVRRSRVCEALLWLQRNNPYYKDVIIDKEILQTLPENGSILSMIPRLQNDQGASENLDDDENDNEAISRTFVPSLPPTRREGIVINETLDRLQNDDPPITWPDIEGIPISEFQTPGYMVRAFPTLYPYGRADLRSERAREIKPAEYFKHLLWYKDGRFARHSRWRYFALNSSMRWRALQEGHIFVKQNLNERTIDVAEIQEMIANGDKNMADRIMRYGEGLRGTRQFWMARRSELMDMIRQIGHQGLIFFTLSAADLHWPELHKLMVNDDQGEVDDSAKQRQQNVIDNPHIVAWFFNKRFENFFNDVLVKQWELEDWWYRFEWQHRGSVHVHGIGRKRNAPIINWNEMKSDENEMKKVIEYVDSLVTTINPDIDAAMPGRHPCQKHSDEIKDNSQQDYIELINKVQRHTRCSPSYCLRVNKRTGQQICKFGYPKDHNELTFIREDDQGQPELITARNDQYINPHNRLQLQGWRANVDLKPVLSIHAALQYISKYASKAEPQSTAFSEIFSQILNDSNPNDPSLTSIQKFLVRSVAERDISAQETCHLLLSIPLYHSSRRFVSLNLNEETLRWIRGTGRGENDEELAAITDAGSTTKSPLRKYWDRDEYLKDFSLFNLYLNYKYVNGNWQRCEKENIVRIWPRPSAVRNGDQWEEFCRIKVLLHVPHRSMHQLNGNNIPWSSVYYQYYDMINSGPNDLLGQEVDKEAEINDEESFDEISDEEQEEFRFDWMRLAEMGPNVRIDSNIDLGSRDMDRDHDWTNDAQQKYSNEDLAKACDFVYQAAHNSKNDDNYNIKDLNRVSDIICDNLNEKQKIIFDRIETHYKNAISGLQVEALRIHIMGTAGTGKSYLIKAIRERLQSMARNGKSPVIVIAPTGVAAFNIDGGTIHSTLSIPIMEGKKFDLNNICLKQLQERLQDVRYIIIDEKSMVGRRMLGLIDMRLKQAFPEKKNEPFGGRSIIMFGDFGQIPPVLDLPMYADNVSHCTISNNGMVAYKQFNEVYELKAIQRQSGESEEQRHFRDILSRIREGNSTFDDWRTLAKRFEGNLSQIERERFADAISIVTKWEDVDRINIEMLKKLNCPIAKICAVHTGRGEAKRANSDVAKGLEAELLLAKGCRVMLTANLWTEAGLVNGSMGTVKDILFENDGPSALPTAVFIKFDKYNGPTITSAEGEEVVPIAPIERSWEDKNGTRCSRLQIPIRLAWAITVHKSQGLTLEKAKIDIGNKEFAAGLTFVALSRVRSLGDVCLKPFTLDRLERIKHGKRLKERKAEEERLRSMILL